MKEIKKNLPIPIFILLIACFQTLASLLPGFILIQDGVNMTSGILLLILYLLISEFFQFYLRRDNIISLPMYIGKIVVSLLLIWSISRQLSYQHGVILIAYEVFQFLIFSLKYAYAQRLSYVLMNAFFKGIIFNLVVSLNNPKKFQLIYFKPYLFSFLLILTITLIIQMQSTQGAQKKQLFAFAGVSSLIMLALLFYQQQQDALTFVQLLPLIIIGLGACGYFFWSKNRHTADLTLSVASVLILFIYYYF